MTTSVQAEIVEHRIKILQAFLDNKKIQHKYDSGEVYGLWYDGTGPKSPIPNFELYIYRIKPEVKKYRPAILLNDKNEPYILAINDSENSMRIEGNTNFVKWASENWIEYEV